MSLQETLASIAKSGLPLQGKLDALKAEFETNIAPAPVVEALHRATDELIASGAPGKALKAGDVAPAFTLPDADGKPVSSRDLLRERSAGGHLLSRRLVPLLQLRPHRPRGRSGRNRGAGRGPGRSLSADRAQQPQVATPNGLGFLILSDKGGEVGAQFGVRWTVPNYLREIHKALGADLTQIQRRG